MKDARETIAEIIEYADAYDDPKATADLVLRCLPDIVGAMVKPLEWSDCFVQGCSGVKSGDYEVVEGLWGRYRGGRIDYSLHSKQAANDHHRAQVLGALGL